MAPRRTRTETIEVVTPPSVSPQVGIDLLRKQVSRGKEFLSNRPIDGDKYSAWENTTREFLVKAFGSGSPNVSNVIDIGKYGSFPFNPSPEWCQNHYAQSLQSQLTTLESLIDLLQTEIEISSSTSNTSQATTQPVSNRVFIVHGHQESFRETTARFIEKLGLTPIILHEQPNKGRTIVEKFTDYSDVGFAVVLMTADDKGGLISESHDQHRPRARQNVVLELGFFLGKIGRGRVCALYQDGVEIPSDYNGVLFVKLDNGGAWKFQLAKEIKAAGIDVDLNKAV